jgi:hypothetical protein
MDYSRIIQEAWRLTWAHRFLWLFGLFAGASGGTCGGSGFNSGSFNSGGGADRMFDDIDGRQVERVFSQIGAWVANNIGVILLATAVLMLIGLVFLVLHFIAKGALIASSARLALGEGATRSEGWALGRRFAWRYARLTVLAFLIGLAILLVVGVGVLLVVVAGQISTALAVLLGIVLGLVGFAGVIVGGIALGIALAYAERAIAIDDLGARASLRRGIAVLRMRLGPSFILWLISLALAIGVGIAIAIVAVVLLLPIGGAVAVTYMAAGLSATTILVGAAALLLFFLGLWLVSGVASAFMSTFWTLGYLSASGRWNTA